MEIKAFGHHYAFYLPSCHESEQASVMTCQGDTTGKHKTRTGIKPWTSDRISRFEERPNVIIQRVSGVLSPYP